MCPSAQEENTKLKFLLDENIDVRLKKFLGKQGCSVFFSSKGISDPKVFAQAKKNQAVLLTNDKDFANTDIYTLSSSIGIIVFRIHPPTLQNLIYALDRILLQFKPKDLLGKLIIAGKQGAEIISS